VSHHVTHEFGSPSLPQTREAVALHFLDDMDSKMGAMSRTSILLPARPAVPSGRNATRPSRALLRPNKFLASNQVPGKRSPAGPNGAPAGADAPNRPKKEIFGERIPRGSPWMNSTTNRGPFPPRKKPAPRRALSIWRPLELDA